MKKDTGTRRSAKRGTSVRSGSGTGTEKKKMGRPKGSKSGYTVSVKSELSARKNGKTVPFLSEEDQMYNAKLIEFSLKSYEISLQANINDPESLRSCFLNYLKLCIENGFKIGTIAACSSMGISPEILYQWRSGIRRQNNPEYKKLAEFVTSVCSTSREQLISDSKLNPVIGIFWQRNFDRLRNDTEQQQSLLSGENDQDEMTTDEYRKKYGKLIEE